MRLPKVRTVVTYLVALLMFMWTIIPLYWLVNMAFMHNLEVIARPTHWYVHQPTLSNFIRLFGFTWWGPRGEPVRPVGQGPQIRLGLLNSLIISVITMIITLLVSLPVAYALGRLNFKYKNGLFFAILFGRSYPPVSAAIPFYTLYKASGLLGTRVGLIIVYLTLAIPLVVWVMTGFFMSLPRTLEAAARVDGCSRLQAIYKVVIPVAMPGVAACAVIGFFTLWSEFAFATILTFGSDAQPFPPTLGSLFWMVPQPAENAAALSLALVPPIILALIFQGQLRKANLVTLY